MISIIICSRTETISSQLNENIEKTIGVAYEIIPIDNSKNKYSIFEAYNLGVQKSQYPYLCFMHDDIIYHTQNWGNNVLKHFEDAKTGAIGIAGSPYATQMAGSWWGGGLVNQYILPVGNNEPEITITYKDTAVKNEVVLLDGVWFCTRKSLFNKISFDTTSFNGFHFYDVDISIQIHQLGYKLFSVFDVLIRHHTSAKMDKSWSENAMIFNKKWASVLPISCIKLSYNKRCEAELKTLKEYIYILLYNNYSAKTIYKLVILQFIKFKKGFFYYKTPLIFIKTMIISFRYHKERTSVTKSV
ncbi:MAG: hypothetical protein JWP44_1248 [Mucilaginibacter sp.]|nr:hypothetical protein [Mucilaginibacter sp.]